MTSLSAREGLLLGCERRGSCALPSRTASPSKSSQNRPTRVALFVCAGHSDPWHTHKYTAPMPPHFLLPPSLCLVRVRATTIGNMQHKKQPQQKGLLKSLLSCLGNAKEGNSTSLPPAPPHPQAHKPRAPSAQDVYALLATDERVACWRETFWACARGCVSVCPFFGKACPRLWRGASASGGALCVLDAENTEAQSAESGVGVRLACALCRQRVWCDSEPRLCAWL